QLSRRQRPLRDRLQSRILISAKRAHAASGASHRHRYEDAGAIEITGSLGFVTTGALHRRGRAAQRRDRVVHVDGRVRHALLQELLLYDSLAMLHDEALDLEPEIVHD